MAPDRLRAFERALALRFGASSPPCIGDEALVVGIANALGPIDALVPAFHDHAFAIALGEAPSTMFEDLTRDRWLSTAISADRCSQLIGTSHSPGYRLSLAANIAICDRLKGSSRQIVCVLRDCAVDHAVFRETLEKTIEWDLPVVFVFENNQLVDSPVGLSLYEQARGYGRPADEVDGMSVLSMRSAVRRALANASRGPRLIEALTFHPAEDQHWSG